MEPYPMTDEELISYAVFGAQYRCRVLQMKLQEAEQFLAMVSATRTSLQEPQPTTALNAPAQTTTTATTTVTKAKVFLKKRSRMSAAGRKAISDAQKKRWAKYHKQNRRGA